MDINIDLITRLKVAIEREQDLSIHYSHEIVRQGETVRRLALAESLCRRDLAQAGMPAPRVVYEAQDGERRDGSAAAWQQAQAEHTAGRPAVQETMRSLARQASEAGRDPAIAIEAFTRQSAAPDPGGFLRALSSAVQAREAAEAQQAELERLRGQHGRRGAALKRSLQEAETWLAQHHLAQRAAA